MFFLKQSKKVFIAALKKTSCQVVGGMTIWLLRVSIRHFLSNREGRHGSLLNTACLEPHQTSPRVSKKIVNSVPVRSPLRRRPWPWWWWVRPTWCRTWSGPRWCRPATAPWPPSGWPYRIQRSLYCTCQHKKYAILIDKQSTLFLLLSKPTSCYMTCWPAATCQADQLLTVSVRLSSCYLSGWPAATCQSDQLLPVRLISC